MPRRRAAQSAASKISVIADDEQTVKKEKSSRSGKADGNPARKSSRQKKTNTIDITPDIGKSNENNDPSGREKSEIPVPTQGSRGKSSTSKRKGKGFRNVEHAKLSKNDNDEVIQSKYQTNFDGASEEFQKKGETVVKRAGTRGGPKKKVDNKIGCLEETRKTENNKVKSRGRGFPEVSITSCRSPTERRKRTRQINPTTMKPEAAQYKESRHKEDEKENGDPGRQERRARGRKKADGEIKNNTVDSELEATQTQTTAMKVGFRKTKIKQAQGLFSSKTEDHTDNVEQKIRTTRSQISQWWQKCFFGAQGRKLFRPYYDENWTTSNLLVHTKEEARLRKYYEKNHHIFDNISLHQNEESKMATVHYRLQEKDQKITELEKSVQEMRAQQSIIQTQSLKKDEDMTVLRNSLEKLDMTYTKENDDNSLTEDFHEVNVLHEFCQKQKKTIRNLQREIEQLREKAKQTSDTNNTDPE
ncbi:uncharacterized protein LOC125673361 isoform X2 [Ostrea edulis]|uniref:uncharacterized protein LOC125673361 isoform X2 n=1 Tax=Ostrea edulis TaxID=37623 RepID=UPI0024AE94D5|nr:uncharacterized protein LOC125673361 isoform X2 [Ostrea edulis]